MKQRRKLFALRIKAGNIRPFVEITEAASQRKVVRFVRTAVLAGNDMFDVKSDKPGSRLRQSAVFANIAGSAADK